MHRTVYEVVIVTDDEPQANDAYGRVKQAFEEGEVLAVAALSTDVMPPPDEPGLADTLGTPVGVDEDGTLREE